MNLQNAKSMLLTMMLFLFILATQSATISSQTMPSNLRVQSQSQSKPSSSISQILKTQSQISLEQQIYSKQTQSLTQTQTQQQTQTNTNQNIDKNNNKNNNKNKNVKSQLGASVVGFIIGPIVFILAFVVVWYNQKRCSINIGRLSTIRQLLDNNNNSNNNINVDQQQNGSTAHKLGQIQQNLIKKNNKNHQNHRQPQKLIYTTGKPKIHTAIHDPLTHLTLQHSILLTRQVQVREYRTFTSKSNQQAILGWYSYHEQYQNNNSNSNKNMTIKQKQNKIQKWFIKSQIFTPQKIDVNGYYLQKEQIKQNFGNFGSNYQPEITIQMGNHVIKEMELRDMRCVVQGGYLYFVQIDKNSNNNNNRQQNMKQQYIQKQIDILKHGTLRIKYTAYTPSQTISIIAGKNSQSQTLTPYLLLNNPQNKLCCQDKPICCTCNTLGHLLKPIQQILIIMQGTVTKQQIIAKKLTVNTGVTYGLRIFAYLLMVLSIYAFFSPIVDLLGQIPIFGWWIKSTASGMIFLAAVIICVPIFLAVFSIAWVVYRPKIGVVIAGVAIAFAVLLVLLDQVYKQ